MIRKSNIFIAFVAALMCGVSAARADFAFTVGSGQTGFSFTASTGGTALCAASVTHCFAAVPINTAGAAFFTSGNPGLVTLTGTNTVSQATAGNLNATVVGTGTFATQAAQSGTWNITNVSGTVSLPTGASTAAKQPALGTAGAASTDVITIQGIASGTVVPVSGTLTAVSTVTNLAQMNGAALLMGNGATGTGSQRLTIANDNTLPTGWASSVAQGSTTSGQTGPLAQCAVTTAAPTYTTAQTSPLSCDTTGNLRVLGTGVAQGSTTSGQTGSLVMGAVTTGPPTYTTAQTSPVSLDTAGNTRVAATPYPSGATPYTATATGTTGATTATLAGAASVTTYLCGFSIRANATAAATGNATVTGVITATLNFTQWTAPNASGLGLTEMIFAPCVPASAANTSIAVVSAAPGTGGVVSVTSWGYKL